LKMKESVLKTFWRDTYQSKSPIPFIISVQVILFVLIHIFDLLKEVNVLQVSLYDYAIDYLSLPISFSHFLKQPWSIATYSFLYTGLFQLLFDCLWLYWMGNISLNFLSSKQFLFLYFSATFLGASSYLGLCFYPIQQISVLLSFGNATAPMGALVAARATRVRREEIRLFLLCTLTLNTLALAING